MGFANIYPSTEKTAVDKYGPSHAKNRICHSGVNRDNRKLRIAASHAEVFSRPNCVLFKLLVVETSLRCACALQSLKVCRHYMLRDLTSPVMQATHTNIGK